MEGAEANQYKISSQHEPSSKFQYEWKQGFRDTIQIQNRIKILEIEKQKKIKDIQKKLNLHKRNVGLKILKHQRQQAVQNLHEKERMNVTQYFNKFQQDKKKREDNIKNLKLEILQNRNKQFWSVKRQRQEINKKINQQKLQEHLQKIEKRNRVRLMQIQAKQNVVSSWNQRLQHMKQNRQKTISKKLKQHEQNLISIAKFSKMENKMLKQINKAEDMEEELSIMIDRQNRLTGSQLSRIYTIAS